MPTDVLETARASVAHIPGLTIEAAHWYRMMTLTGMTSGEIGISLDITGWGPTLHARRRRWDILHPAATGGAQSAGPITDAQAVALAAKTTRHALSQETIAAWAMMEDIETPLDQPDAAEYGDLAHLSIDRRLLDVMVANRGIRGVAARLLDMLPRIVRSSEGGEEAVEADELDAELQGAANIVGGRGVLWFEEPVGATGQYDGMALEIEAAIPATVLAVAVGRRLGDIIATGIPSLDASVIEVVAEGSFADLRFEFAPDLVRIENIAELREHLPGGAR
jgi:hypothetical protein